MNTFERWLENNRDNLSDNAVGLFRDSLRCFKNNITRPAYLLAYQGMLLTLRNKILMGKMPSGFREPEWENICKEIRFDGIWDERTYDRVVQRAKDDGTKPAILNMSPFVREQFQYWRKLRNVCAHYKDFDFKSAHVITLCAFIASYLMKISIEGGAVSLLAEFKDYCDPSKYSPMTSLNPLISKISDMVDEKEMKGFIDSVVHVVAKSHNRDSNEFLKILLFLDGESNRNVREATYNFITADIERRNRFIEANPELVGFLLTTPVDVRVYWKKFLKYSPYAHKIATSLIESGLVPMEEINELLNILLVVGYESDRYLGSIDETALRILKRNGYFDLFLKNYIDEPHIKRDCKTICYKTNFYMSHLQYLELDIEFVRKMIDLFSELPYPYTLRDRIRDELWVNDEFKNNFKTIAEHNGIEIPDTFLK